MPRKKYWKKARKVASRDRQPAFRYVQDPTHPYVDNQDDLNKDKFVTLESRDKNKFVTLESLDKNKFVTLESREKDKFVTLESRDKNQFVTLESQDTNKSVTLESLNKEKIVTLESRDKTKFATPESQDTNKIVTLESLKKEKFVTLDSRVKDKFVTLESRETDKFLFKNDSRKKNEFVTQTESWNANKSKVKKTAASRQSDNTFTVHGNFHQGDIRYGRGRGTQCAVNSLFSVVYSKYKPVDIWESSDLDEVLDLGHYTYCEIQNSSNWTQPLLLVSELPNTVSVNGNVFNISMGESLVGLVLGDTENVGYPGIMSFQEALKVSLKKAYACFVTFKEQTFAIIHTNAAYYRFDSHSRGVDGLVSEDGSSVLLRRDSIQEIYTHCVELATSMNAKPNTQFEVTPVDIGVANRLTDNSTYTTDEYRQAVSETEYNKTDNFNHSKLFMEQNMNITNIDLRTSTKLSPCSNSYAFATTKNSKTCSTLVVQQPLTDCDIVFLNQRFQIRLFKPLPFATKVEMCQRLRLYSVVVASEINVSRELTHPCKRHKIKGDGNCFFRAISYSISGTEQNHLRIRHLIVKHIEHCSDFFKNYLRQHFFSVEQYISETSMYTSGTWATEMEILALADLLGVDVYTFRENVWLRYQNERSLTNTTPVDHAIYLIQSDLHYDVAICVKSDDKRMCTDCAMKIDNTCLKQNQKNSSNKRRKYSHTAYQNKLERDIARYKSDSSLRERKKSASAYLYENNAFYRCGKKANSRHKYRRDPDYQEKQKNAKTAQYQTDIKFREKKISKGVIKYKTDMGHRGKVINRGVTKYKRDSEHRAKVINRGVTKYKRDMEHRAKVINRGVTKYKRDMEHRAKVINRGVTKYKRDMEHRAKVIQRSVRRYQSNESYRDKLKKRNKLKYRNDDVYRKALKSQQRKRYRTNLKYRREKIRRSITNYRRNPELRRKAKRQISHNYSRNKSQREHLRKYNKSRRNDAIKRRQITKNIIEDFKKKCLCGPDYICCVCHRLLFQNQVVICCLDKFKNKGPQVENAALSAISDRYLHKCTSDCKNNCALAASNRSNLWICFTCHAKLLKGKIPAESSLNNLSLDQIPSELNCLNSLEQHLISLQIPFMKMLALPKGSQRALQGPVVCVPSDMTQLSRVLPRNKTDDQLIRIKLKRRLHFKGHYDYKFVRKSRLKDAVEYLVGHNKWYKDISFDENWNDTIPEIEQTPNQEINPESEGVEDKEIIQQTTVNENSQQRNHSQTDTNSSDDPPTNINDDQNTGLVLDTCLQPVDIAQEILDQYTEEVLCIAPAENNSPISILRDDTNEAKSFPVLFPKGTGTFADCREEKITLSRYLHSRLMNADNRFAKDVSYLFHAQYRSEIQQVLSSISVAMRKGCTSACGKKITAKTLTNKESLKEIIKSDEGYRFLKPIRGTPPYWQAAQKDVFAMLRQLGIPTWFASFSSADLRWPEMVEVILRQQGDFRKASQLDWTEKCDILRSNPVTVARMFEHRFQIFLKDVILSPAAPIGKIIDYFYRIEFQQRGSPHVHGVFWVKNAPKLDDDTDEDVVKFIDSYVTCSLPSLEKNESLRCIVNEVQKHSSRHSKSCKKKGTECRFNFPRPPSKITFISRPVSPQESKPNTSKSSDDTVNPEITPDRAKELLNKIWQALSTDTAYQSIEKLLIDVGISEQEYRKAFDVISKKPNIVLRRGPLDVWVNQYNPVLLEAWGANLDLQYVLDAYSCIVYIVSYMSKAEREMSLLLEHTQTEIQEDGNKEAREAMRKLGTVYLHSREVSAQEAVFRVCNLKLKQSSRKVQFIPVGQDPVKMSLPLPVLQSKNSKDLDTDEIWMTSLVDRYRYRPNENHFNNMCLASFCSEYRVLYGSELINAPVNKNSHELQNGLGYIKKRTRSKPAVVRYPRFSVTRSPEKYYHSILQLFLPHRNDAQLKPPKFETFEDFYDSGVVKYITMAPVKQIVDNNRAMFEKSAEKIEKAQMDLRQFGPLEDAWAQICPETETARLECKMIYGDKENSHSDEENELNVPELLTSSDKMPTTEKHASFITRKEAIPLLRSLNRKQSDIFYKVRQWCVERLNGLNPQPFRIFVTGGAGTGKSHLIKCISYEAARILAPSLPNPDVISVLITAPTGVAAFNIGAATIHSTFAIPTDVKLPYQPLGEEKLNTLRAKLEYLAVLIIDEVSMVDHKILTYIHGRLRQIKQSRDYSLFGNVSILAVGDFYQLPPVKGKALHVEHAGVDLWNGNFCKAELTEIMRQKDDVEFACLLNRMRTKTNKDKIRENDLNFFNSRETAEQPQDALHIFATNAEVDNHNLQTLHSMCDDPILIECQDFIRDSRSGQLQKRDEKHSRVYRSNLQKSISVGIGARVMLTKNLDVSDGLVNGVFGTVSEIRMPADSSFPSFINVVFDKENVGRKLRRNNSILEISDEGTPIEPQEDIVNNKGGVRRQFPLKLAWASTAHKVQGLTVNKAVVSLNKIFSAGQAYVALSRVTSARGLIIQDFKEDNIYCNRTVELALSRMPDFIVSNRGCGNKRTRILLHNIEGLPVHFQDIQSDERFTDSTLICLTETWLPDTSTPSGLCLKGFTLHHSPRSICYDQSLPLYQSLKSQSHGGVGIYAKENVNYQIPTLDIKNLESIQCLIPELDLNIAVIYRPQSYTVSSFLLALQQLIVQLQGLSRNSIIMGDLNQDISAQKDSSIQQHLHANGYRQIVESPTTEKDTLIDHVYVRGTLPVTTTVLPTYFSFHEAIEILI